MDKDEERNVQAHPALGAPYGAAPEGETPEPDGEEGLDWLHTRDVRQPQSGHSKCCGTWELVEPALVISVRERDAILVTLTRLTRELAEARAQLAEAAMVRVGLVEHYDAARADAARLREALEFYAKSDFHGDRARRALAGDA